MRQSIGGPWSPRGAPAACDRAPTRIIVRLALGASAWLLAAMLGAPTAFAEDRGGPARHPADDRPRASVAPAGRSDGAGPSRVSGASRLRGEPGGPVPDGGWSAMAGVALILIASGGIAAWARRTGPRATSGAVQVVGRVGLSPRHSVYLLRVGRRVLVLGAGPQGPPALITELEEVPQDVHGPVRGAES